MPRRSPRYNPTILIVILGIALILGIIQAILPYLLYILLGIVIYFYISWQDRKLSEYNVSWKELFNNELKPPLKIIIPILLLGTILLLVPKNENSLPNELSNTNNVSAKEEAENNILKRKIESSNTYLGFAEVEFEKKRYKRVLKHLITADSFYDGNIDVALLKGRTLMNLKKYKEGISLLEGVIGRSNELNDDIYLNIGLCYLKMGNRPKAIFNLYEAVKLDNSEAEEIYDKVNPKIKKVIGYYTKCCDGSSSSARGRGACSHHGGVCNWNAPIYSEERRYEVN